METITKKHNRKMIAVAMVAMMAMVAVVPMMDAGESDAALNKSASFGFGSNSTGQIGAGETETVLTPQAIGSSLGSIADIVTSTVTTFILTNDGKLYGCGQNNLGQMGDGTTDNVLTLKQIGATLGTIAKVVCSDRTTFVITSDGKLYGAGWNNYGQMGDGTTTPTITTFKQIGSTLGTIKEVSCSSYGTFFITNDGKLYGCGLNNYGQMGDGTTTNALTPKQIGSTLGTIATIKCAGENIVYITSNGKLYGNGRNHLGQMGDGTTTNALTPKQIGASLGTIVSVTTSGATTIFLASDGKLYGCGQNNYGQLGDGTTTNTLTPKQIGASLGTIASFTASSGTTFMLVGGKLYGCGQNNHGQLGDGTTDNVLTPKQIASTLGTIASVSASPNTTMIIESEYGKLYGMGANSHGQIGDGTTADVLVPKQIASSMGIIEKAVCTADTTFFILAPEYTISFAYTASTDPDWGTIPTATVASKGASFSVASNVLTIREDTYTATAADGDESGEPVFVGWFSDQAGTTPITTGTITAAKTFYAKFDFDLTVLNIPIRSTDGGTVSTDSISVTYGSEYAISDTTLTITPSDESAQITITATVGEPTAQYTYSFGKWTIGGVDAPASGTLTAESVIRAVFDATVNTYTITWIIGDLVETQDHEYGATPTHETPEAPEEGDVFKGWDPPIAKVTGPATYTATFGPNDTDALHKILDVVPYLAILGILFYAASAVVSGHMTGRDAVMVTVGTSVGILIMVRIVMPALAGM